MLHHLLTPADGIHPIHHWEVADIAGRDALGVVVSDIGRVCRVLADGQFYILKSTGPSAWAIVAALTPLQLVITDAGAYFVTKNVEAALQVLGKNWRNTCIPIAVSDESTALTTGTGKVTFRMPFAFKLSAIRASLTTAQATGALLTIDVKENGVSLMAVTKITLDNTERSTTTAATPAVLSDVDLADDSEMTVDITQIGDGTAKGLKLYLIGSVQ